VADRETCFGDGELNMGYPCPICLDDEFICVKCERIFCSNKNCIRGTIRHWSPEITGNKRAGAICDNCHFKYTRQNIKL
jgi:hypothetical protein